MITGVDVVFIHVKDPVKMKQWYSEILELEAGFFTPDLHWQEFNFPEKISTRFALDSVSEDPSEVEKQKIMISFKVDDLESYVMKLETKGIKFYGSPKIRDVGPTLFATIKDIEGNWIQFSQRK
jgi:extradiol dioxygenase family protein